MESFGLPPGSEHRSWMGKKMRLDLVYSVAGVSTTLFLTTPEGSILVDAGDGALRDMIEIGSKLMGGVDYSDRESMVAMSSWFAGALITHPHFDHYAGLLPFLNFLQLIGRRDPFPVVYPEGSKVIEELVDLQVENLFEENLYDIDLIPVVDGQKMRIGNLNIEAKDTLHRDSRPGHVGIRIPAVSYSVEYRGERIVFSGDTGDVGKLKEIAKGADLLVVEATYPGRNDLSEGVHLTVDEALEAGSVAKEKFLIHFTGASYRRVMDEKLIF